MTHNHVRLQSTERLQGSVPIAITSPHAMVPCCCCCSCSTNKAPPPPSSPSNADPSRLSPSPYKPTQAGSLHVEAFASAERRLLLPAPSHVTAAHFRVIPHPKPASLSPTHCLRLSPSPNAHNPRLRARVLAKRAAYGACVRAYVRACVWMHEYYAHAQDSVHSMAPSRGRKIDGVVRACGNVRTGTGRGGGGVGWRLEPTPT